MSKRVSALEQTVALAQQLSAAEKAQLIERIAPTMSRGGPFFEPTPSIEELAAQQGVKPVRRFEDLLGDFWPEDESADDIIAAVREWRREGR